MKGAMCIGKLKLVFEALIDPLIEGIMQKVVPPNTAQQI